MRLGPLLFAALAAIAAAAPSADAGGEGHLDKRAPTKAECCCCYGGPSVGCAADLNCSGITASICLDTRCPFK
ncbi:uncharacterized protein ColSpa_04197 [Colletotrichum spaethianum]|uniref:Uncharacterized protein n=1 Tax=Colletotrichum spaethianum TaxID=700344 RepID=A0AA37P5K5_9PEZI|nr:uncharacterized protein ColSpa_04197 [Colletotrichum spaethianum]GKT44016.1 hypothetical protein ColSpa_04197 [Colletotrichum spaethianum]